MAAHGHATDNAVHQTSLITPSTPLVFQRIPGTVGLIIACLYGACSASMAFANKAVLTSYSFDYPFFLVTCQMVITIVIVEFLRLTGTTSLVPFTLKRGYLFLAPSIFYATNSVLSLSALSGMNIPMYGVIKRCAPVIILVLGVAMLGKPFPKFSICTAILMITLGCITAGYGDLSFDLKAYAYGIGSVISQAIYLLLVEKHANDIGAAESLHLNSYNTLPMLLVFSIATGECWSALANFNVTDVGFLVTFTLVTIFGCLLNYLLFLCTTYNSALTTSVTGTLKSIIQTVVGIFTFGGISINIFSMSGIALNMTGGIIYTYVKYKASQLHKHLLSSELEQSEEKGHENEDRNSHLVIVHHATRRLSNH